MCSQLTVLYQSKKVCLGQKFFIRPKKKIVVFQMTLRKKSGSVGREKLFFFFFLKEQQFRGFQNYV